MWYPIKRKWVGGVYLTLMDAVIAAFQSADSGHDPPACPADRESPNFPQRNIVIPAQAGTPRHLINHRPKTISHMFLINTFMMMEFIPDCIKGDKKPANLL